MIDTQSIRVKILDLAIRGQLTEQLPEDGSVDTLYCEIQTEKQAFIKAGIIKKEKPLAVISEEDHPFEIPSRWRWVYLGELFQHNTGKALNSSDTQGQKLEYITTSNLYWDRFVLDDLKTMPFTESEIEKCTVKKGDLLVCEGGDIGRSAIWPYDYDMRIQNHIHRLRKYCADICTEFYYYLLWLYKQTGRINGIGIGLQGFSAKRVHSLIVPLAPTHEAERVVEIIKQSFSALDTIDELQAQYTENLTVLKSKLIDSSFQGKLTEQIQEDGDAEKLYQRIQTEKETLIKAGDIKKAKPLPDITEDDIPFDIPINWKWVRLGTVLNEVIVPQRDKPKQFDGDIPWCRIEDAEGDYMIQSHSNQCVSWKTIEEMNLRVFPVGTVLSACSGGSIGRILITKTELCTNQTFNGLVCSSGLYNRYLFHYLRQSINRLKNMGSGSAMEYISQKKIREMLIPLPPLEEQKRIVQIIDELVSILVF